MKNCEVTIIQNHSNGTVQTKYQFDDYRVAQAICNILDNVGEPHVKVILIILNGFPLRRSNERLIINGKICKAKDKDL